MEGHKLRDTASRLQQATDGGIETQSLLFRASITVHIALPYIADLLSYSTYRFSRHMSEV